MSEKEKNNDKRPIEDIIEFLQNAKVFFKRMWWLMVILALIIGAALPLVQKSDYTPKYRAYCSFSVKVKNNATASDTNSLYGIYYDKDLAAQLEKTFKYIVSSDLLSDALREKLGTQINVNNIYAKCIEGSNLFELNTYAATPEEAGLLLESVMSVYEEISRYVIGDLDVDMVEETVIQTTPSGAPNLIKAAITGAAIGAGIGAAIILLMAFFRNTVRKPNDLEKHLNIPCLGVVPITDINKRGISEVSSTHSQGEFRENIRGIARKLDEQMKKDGFKIIVVTSTAPDEGKSTVSLALAEILASWGNKTVIFDGDLRNPTLYRRTGFKKKEFHLEKAITGEIPVKDVIQKVNKNGLNLIGNSFPVEQPTVLINSDEMKEFIKNIAVFADCLIIDTPPCGAMSDAAFYLEYADAAIYVVRHDSVYINEIVNAVDNLGQSDGKILGYVLNGATQSSEGYGKYSYGRYSYGKYGYGYGYYGKYGYGKYGYGYSSNPYYNTYEDTDDE